MNERVLTSLVGSLFPFNGIAGWIVFGVFVFFALFVLHNTFPWVRDESARGEGVEETKKEIRTLPDVDPRPQIEREATSWPDPWGDPDDDHIEVF
jgi:hypothetical protein